MLTRTIRFRWKWPLIAIAILAGWMLGSLRSPAQDMFETPAEYTAGPATAIDGTGAAGRPVRAADPAMLWVPRGDHLEEWEVATGKVTATVPLDHPPTALVLTGDGKTAYVATGSNIAVVDTAAGSVTRTLKLVAPANLLAMSNVDSAPLLAATGSTVKRIDVTKSSAQSIDVGGAITQLATAGDLTFALLADARKVVALNAADGTASDTWTLDAKPLAAIVDAPNHRLLVACDDRQLRIVDTDSGQMVSTTPITSGTTGMCLCAAKNILFVAGAGTVDVLHADDPGHYSAMKPIPLPPGAHGPTIDPSGNVLTMVTDDGGKTTLCVFKRHEQ